MKMMLRRQAVQWAVIAFFATQPLVWISVAGEAGRAVKPVHLAFLALALAAFLCWGGRLITWPRRGWPAMFVGLYVAGLTWSWSTLMWSGTPEGMKSAVKDTAYFAIFLLMMATWNKLSNAEKKRTVAMGVLLGLCAFFLFAEIVFLRLGRNFIREYVMAMLSGNAAALQFDFYPKLFNSHGASTLRATDADYVGTSLRNTLVGAFVLYFFIVNAYAGGDLDGNEAVWRRMLRQLLTIASLVLVVLSVSRSNWAALALGVLVVIASAAAKPGHRRLTARRGRSATYSRRLLILTAGCAVLIGGISLIVSSKFTDVIGGRIGQVAEDSRLNMYGQALTKINERPFIGYGLAAPIGFETGEASASLEVHNLFLASWHETGLPGFILSVAFYSALVMAWLRQIFDSGRKPDPDGPSPIWLSGLLALPMVRMLVSGAGGGMTLVEWLAVAVFLSEISRSPGRESTPASSAVSR